MGTRILKVMLAMLAGFVFALPAAAQAITAKALAAFEETSVSQYGDETDYSLEDVLFVIVQTHAAPKDVLAKFAAKTGAPPETAEAYVRLILDIAAAHASCEEGDNKRPLCSFKPGAPLYARMEKLGLSEPTGGLLFSVASNINLGWVRDEAEATAALAELAGRHPAAKDLLGRLYAYGHEGAYLMPLLASGRLGDAEAIAIAKEARGLPPEALAGLLSVGKVSDTTAVIFAFNAEALSEEAVKWDGWVDALLEAAERKASGASELIRAGLAQTALTRKLDLGMNAEAVAGWYAYPADVRALMPLAPGACSFGTVCDNSAGTAYAFADSMAAALWVTGHREDALALASATPPGFPARGPYDDKVHAAVMEAMSPKLRDSDLFGAFIEDKVPGWTRPAPQTDDRPVFDGAPGWLFDVEHASPALRTLVGARLRGAGHADMADHLANVGPMKIWDTWRNVEPAKTYAFILPTELSASAAAWRERIAVANKRLEAERAVAPVHVSTKALDAWWTEKKLPDGLKAWRETDKIVELPAKLSLPTDPAAVLRYSPHGKEHAIVYMSGDYDRPGEIPAFGIWFAETVSGAWQRPVFLGLQQHFPYVVTPASRLPLFSEDGKLTLEVRAEEIDGESITFPPVGLSLKRNEGGIYLEFDLATVRADRDKDGLSDIEERRVGLDFANADTDGDGIADGADPLPLIARGVAPNRTDTRVAQAIAKKIMGHDVGAIMVEPQKPGDDPLLNALGGGGPGPSYTSMATIFLVADPALFAGLAPDFKLMIYSNADVDALKNGAAPFLPPRIISMFSSLDGRTRFVTWSASWVGGSFYVRCTGDSGPCDIEVVSDWIT